MSENMDVSDVFCSVFHSEIQSEIQDIFNLTENRTQGTEDGTQGTENGTQQTVLLRQVSPRDVRWDERRGDAQGFQNLYQQTVLDRYAERIRDCSGFLLFAFKVADKTGLLELKLQSARFCRVRLCPVCQWRRSLVWRAKGFQAFPKILSDYPKSRFIFLGLTVRSCHITELRETIELMNKAWTRLSQRKSFPAVGWVRTIEFTRNIQTDTVHPHFHCLLMVKPSYFSGQGYLSQEKWTELWRECLRINYDPIVDVRAVKPIKTAQKSPEAQEEMLGAILETFKYSVKSNDILANSKNEFSDRDREWLVEFSKQIHKMRLVAPGGILKDYLKDLEREPEDLIHVDESGLTEPDSQSPQVLFNWDSTRKQYKLVD